MSRWTVGRMLTLIGLSVAGWAIIATLCLMAGSSEFGWPREPLLSLRLEQTMLASLVGAALAAAGVAYQAVLRNPLAEPYLLGVSSGASLAVYVWGLPAASLPILAHVSQQGAAFIGALLTLAIVFSLAQRRGRLEPVTLLLVGVIVNAIAGALFLLLFHLGRSQDITRALRFLAGGLQSYVERGQFASAGAVVAIGWLILLYISGQLNVGLLSEAEAESLGVRVQRLRWLALLVASLVTASAVAMSGPIGFVGLVCPHVARLIVGNDQRRLLPVATALGAALLALAEVGSRALSNVTSGIGQLPVGVLTGFLGGPFFLVLLFRARRAEALR